MPKIEPIKIVDKESESGFKVVGYRFVCPGCNVGHAFYTDPGHYKATWNFNGDLEKPTFSPSLLVQTGHYVKGHEKDDCWCTYNEKHPDDPAPFECAICHSFVRDGKIQFLNDCTHELAGQTVELPEIDPE